MTDPIPADQVPIDPRAATEPKNRPPKRVKAPPTEAELEAELLRLSRSRSKGQLQARMAGVRTALRRAREERIAAERVERAEAREAEQIAEADWRDPDPDRPATPDDWPYYGEDANQASLDLVINPLVPELRTAPPTIGYLDKLREREDGAPPEPEDESEV